jgi:hypothetical protein
LSVFVVFFGLVGIIVLLLAWALGGMGSDKTTGPNGAQMEDAGRRHVTYLPQMRQALARDDFQYISEKGGKHLARKTRKERNQIVREYLAALRGDFERLLQLARVIAVLSPEVHAIHEFERISLTLQFSLRSEWIAGRLFLGEAPLEGLTRLSVMVSRLAVQMETAMKELGERAVAASELAKALDGSGLDIQ